MEITVRIKNVYGKDVVYPVCDKAQTFAKLVRQKTFTSEDIKNIKMLGVVIKTEQNVVGIV